VEIRRLPESCFHTSFRLGLHTFWISLWLVALFGWIAASKSKGFLRKRSLVRNEGLGSQPKAAADVAKPARPAAPMPPVMASLVRSYHCATSAGWPLLKP